MMSRTAVRCCRMTPQAMSRSDTTPTSFSPSSTGRNAMSFSSMTRSAARAVAPGSTLTSGWRFSASSSPAVAKRHELLERAQPGAH